MNLKHESLKSVISILCKNGNIFRPRKNENQTNSLGIIINVDNLIFADNNFICLSDLY